MNAKRTLTKLESLRAISSASDNSSRKMNNYPLLIVDKNEQKEMQIYQCSSECIGLNSMSS